MEGQAKYYEEVRPELECEPGVVTLDHQIQSPVYGAVMRLRPVSEMVEADLQVRRDVEDAMREHAGDLGAGPASNCLERVCVAFLEKSKAYNDAMRMLKANQDEKVKMVEALVGAKAALSLYHGMKALPKDTDLKAQITRSEKSYWTLDTQTAVHKIDEMLGTTDDAPRTSPLPGPFFSQTSDPDDDAKADLPSAADVVPLSERSEGAYLRRIQILVDALAIAEHELTTHQGLCVTDKPDKIGIGLRATFFWDLDCSKTLEQIGSLLAANRPVAVRARDAATNSRKIGAALLGQKPVGVPDGTIASELARLADFAALRFKLVSLRVEHASGIPVPMGGFAREFIVQVETLLAHHEGRGKEIDGLRCEVRRLQDSCVVIDDPENEDVTDENAYEAELEVNQETISGLQGELAAVKLHRDDMREVAALYVALAQQQSGIKARRPMGVHEFWEKFFKSGAR